MILFIIRILLNALVIMYFFPLIRGVHFNGDFILACALALIFCIVSAVLEVIAVFLSTVWTLSTFGLALLVLVPLRIFCFWVLPTLSLFLLSYFASDILRFDTWLSAGIAAISLLIIAFITRDRKN